MNKIEEHLNLITTLNMKYLLSIFCLILPGVLFSQNVDFKSSNFKDKKEELKPILEKIEQGDVFMETGFESLNTDEDHTISFINALTLYSEANKFNPDNSELNFKIGKCMLQTSQKTESIVFLEKALKLDPEVNNEIYYYLAKAYKFNYEIDKAQTNFKKCKSLIKGKSLENLGPKINKELSECKSALAFMESPARVWVENVEDVNSEYDDYGASISTDESVMVFNARRPRTTGGGKNSNEDYFADIYITENETGNWSSPKQIGDLLNSNGDDECVAIAPDGQRLFMVKEKEGNQDVYQCNLHGSHWSNPKPLEQNSINTEFNESHASFSHDGIKIYFVTDNPYANKGGTDIFFSGRINTRHKEEWGKQFTIGSEINTKYNDACIFFHPDGKTIYFTSQGHNSMGGYDVFKSVRESGRWSAPVNLGYPVNTVYDEKYISVSASGKHAYVSSNRKEDNKGGYDIFRLTFLGAEKPMLIDTEDQLLASQATSIHESSLEAPVQIDAKNLTVLKGRILDEFTREPVSADIEIVDNDKNEVISTFHSNSESGKFLISLPSGINYGIAVIAKDYLFYSENFDLPEMSDFEIVKKDITLQNVCIGCKIVLRNVFFSTGKFTLRPESTPELERLFKLLNDIPRIKVEISGHTDNTGSEATNLKLSENRAKAVVDFLVKKGIPSTRLQFKGYGSSEPVAVFSPVIRPCRTDLESLTISAARLTTP